MAFYINTDLITIMHVAINTVKAEKGKARGGEASSIKKDGERITPPAGTGGGVYEDALSQG